MVTFLGYDIKSLSLSALKLANKKEVSPNQWSLALGDNLTKHKAAYICKSISGYPFNTLSSTWTIESLQ